MNDNVRRRSPRKLILTVLAVILIIGITAGVTLAILSEKSNSVSNGFTAATVDIETKESFDGSVKKDVYIQNNGSAGVYVRAAIVATWQDANGNIYGSAPVQGTDYTLTGTDSGWSKAGDGYYYWYTAVGAGKTTGKLIGECAPVAGRSPTGYTLHVEIAAQAIQAAPDTAVKDAWGVTVDSNGRISK